MKTLEVTDEQYAFIQHLREEISEQVVGRYGFVRERDAVQFLIDNIDEDVEIDNAIDAAATDDVAASVAAAIDGEEPPESGEVVEFEEDEAVDGGPEDDEDDETDDGAEPDDDEDATAPDDEDAPEAGDGSEDATESTDGDGSASDGASSGGEADDDDMLDEMMSLLETHDDKWEEASSADYRYTVTLPDGSTEDVQTKDDVRALLFKNYR